MYPNLIPNAGGDSASRRFGDSASQRSGESASQRFGESAIQRVGESAGTGFRYACSSTIVTGPRLVGVVGAAMHIKGAWQLAVTPLAPLPPSRRASATASLIRQGERGRPARRAVLGATTRNPCAQSPRLGGVDFAACGPGVHTAAAALSPRLGGMVNVRPIRCTSERRCRWASVSPRPLSTRRSARAIRICAQPPSRGRHGESLWFVVTALAVGRLKEIAEVATPNPEPSFSLPQT